MRLLLAACLLALVLGLGNTASREPERRALDDMEPGKAMVMAIHRYHEHVGELSFSGNLKTGLRCVAWGLFYACNAISNALVHQKGAVLLTVAGVALVSVLVLARRVAWSEAVGITFELMLRVGAVILVCLVVVPVGAGVDLALLG